MAYRLVTFIVYTGENQPPDYDEIQDWRRQVGSGVAEIYEDHPFEDGEPDNPAAYGAQ